MNKSVCWLALAILGCLVVLGPTWAGGQELGPPPIWPESWTGPEGQAREGASTPLQPLESGLAPVNPSNREASRLFYATNYLAPDSPIAWTGNRATCDAGATASGFQDAVLLRLNYFRAMAGVPATVTFGGTYNGKDQKAALMMSANGQLSHNPPTTWTCYTAEGAEAAGNSNLALGASGRAAIDLYMKDPGTGNGAAGHRRWIVFPATQVMGTGDIPATGGSAAQALWVFDSTTWGPRPPTREEFVAWPPPGFVPYQVVYPRWSFSFPQASFASATVTMTQGGAGVPVTLETIANGYGDNTLVWFPTGMTSSQAWPQPTTDTVYTVTINNVVVSGSPRSFTYEVTIFDPATVVPMPSKVGLFRPASGTFYLDHNGNGTWDGCGTDRCLSIGMTGDIPLVGDWNGTGSSKVGLFRPASGTFYLDQNGNGTWDGCGTDRCLSIGMTGDIPLVGDWNGNGATKVGVFRPSAGTFYLDHNGNGTWEGCATDRCLQIGLTGDIPVVGDWNNSGSSKVGLFRPSDGTFYLDYNGNGRWDGCSTDRCLSIGLNGDVPVVGDWNDSGTAKVGTFRSSTGTFYLDYNGNGIWDGCSTDRCLAIGMAGDIPLVGDWGGTGTAKVGVFRPSDGTFYLDFNGNGAWEGCGLDRCLHIGLANDVPLVGGW